MWEWLGDPLAVDVANTVRREGMTYRELWRSGADVVAWARLQDGRVPVPTTQAAHARLAELRGLRDDVSALLRATSSNQDLPADATTRINERVRDMAVVDQLTRRPGRTVMQVVVHTDPIGELTARCAAAAVDLIGGAAHADVGFCDAPSCGQFFMRKRPNTRWCGPACGTRARVARHARRTAGARRG